MYTLDPGRKHLLSRVICTHTANMPDVRRGEKRLWGKEATRTCMYVHAVLLSTLAN
jgi:hypothetical protein